MSEDKNVWNRVEVVNDPKQFLDSQLQSAHDEIQVRGEPDCFVVFRVHDKQLQPIPVAIYGTRAGLYDRFPSLKFKFEDGTELTVGMWWFDDKQ